LKQHNPIKTIMKSNGTRNLLITLLAFLGLGAIGGGAVLIVSPSGKLMGMPLFILNPSPFSDFLIPGIILFLVPGVIPLLLILALLNKPTSKLAEHFNYYADMHWAWTYTIYIAFVLIFWIQIEMVLLSAVSWLHTFYIALLPQVRNNHKK
jgi:hypothetical protein